MISIDRKTMASMIDHTVLKPFASKEHILQGCREALEHKFASVCINPCFIKLVAKELKDSDVKTCTVISFPLGANTSDIKSSEARNAVNDGAQEIDMVINIGALKDGDLTYVENDISQVVKASGGAIVKVIIETCYLTDEEKVIACEIAKKAGASYVKTSTGFATGGATAHDIDLMRRTVGKDLGVKASGGVKTLHDALIMLEAGANRIGASSGVEIIRQML